MTNREFYQTTFSQIHGASKIRWEEFEKLYKRRKRRKPAGRLIVVAAVLCLLAVLSAMAVAVHFLGVQDLLLPKKQVVNEVDEEGFVVSGQTQGADIISLSGYLNTPESQALVEWQEFLAGYDQDGAILKSVGNTIDAELEERYGYYYVYTREMGEALDKIVAKYGLTLHTRRVSVLTREDWIAQVGGDFLGTNTAYSGYIYEDGTFAFDGVGFATSCGVLDFQFRRSVRGSFDEVTLNVGDVSAYQEWAYKTACGETVTLALSAFKSLLLADLEDSFVTLNVLEGTDSGVTAQDLETLADSFDFTLLSPAMPPVEENTWEEDEALEKKQAAKPEKTQETEASAESDLLLPEVFRAVLLDGGSFYDTDRLEDTTLAQMLDENAPEGYQMTVAEFTVVDLDRDGLPEVILREVLDVGTNYGYEVLRQSENGTIYGYALAGRELLDLKVDGTFSYSGSAGSSSVGIMSFTESTCMPEPRPVCSTEPIVSMEAIYTGDDLDYIYYFVGGSESTEEGYQAAMQAQSRKEDASWHSFTRENIETFLER